MLVLHIQSIYSEIYLVQLFISKYSPFWMVISYIYMILMMINNLKTKQKRGGWHNG